MKTDPVCASSLDGRDLEEFRALLALRHCPGLGATRQARLLDTFGSAVLACKHSDEWRALGINSSPYKRGEWRKGAEKELRSAEKSDARILFRHHPAWPRLLKELTDAPALLYLRGNAGLLASPCVAVVGTRNPTAKSMNVARQLGQSLSACGITVVSGMALGIDREVHLGSLKETGASIGVLGTGIDVIYPKSNCDVYERMWQDGLLVSELPPETAPVALNFPVRNRIISGLCLGTVVVEAATKSGSLITARIAAEQNRAVFAVPGDAFNIHSLGCQNLIRQGARAVFGPEDILEDLAPQLKMWEMEISGGAKKPPVKKLVSGTLEIAAAAPPRQEKPPRPQLGGPGGQILQCLEVQGPLHTDQIAAETDLEPGELFKALLDLEMRGLIRLLAGSRYEIVEEK